MAGFESEEGDGGRWRELGNPSRGKNEELDENPGD
jgi:hypothetical protein